jgi:hypothetical protein
LEHRGHFTPIALKLGHGFPPLRWVVTRRHSAAARRI